MKTTWTIEYWNWIHTIQFSDRATQDTFDYYVDEVRHAEEMKRCLERSIVGYAESPRWKPFVDAFKCMKGIEVISAFSLACEVGDFLRFRSADAFAAWTGLIPSEHSSGEHDVRGRITRAGNKHVRRLLIESSWSYWNATMHEKAIRKVQLESPEVRSHTNKGSRRLKRRYEDLLAKGKKPVIANTAIARELGCWIWSIGTNVQSKVTA